MRTILVRVLVFLIGIPALAGLVLLWREPIHLPFNLVAIAVSGLGALELSRFFEKKDAGYRASIFVIPLLGMLLPAATLMVALGLLPSEGILVVLAGATTVILVVQVFRRNEADFGHILTNSASNLMLLLYPGLFISYVIRISTLEHSTALILVFLVAVYCNDSLAYVTGSAFGRSSRRILPISPNKSIPGFLGGFFASIIVAGAAGVLLPEVFPSPIYMSLLFGAVVGLWAILGDLVESALKRSATMKDSGTAIPGRGGFLDNIDSPIFTAPAFFYAYIWLFLA
jgi:phosphatidate cytidylyltransferase